MNFIKFPNIKFHENSSIDSRVVPSRERTGRLTERHDAVSTFFSQLRERS